MLTRILFKTIASEEPVIAELLSKYLLPIVQSSTDDHYIFSESDEDQHHRYYVDFYTTKYHYTLSVSVDYAICSYEYRTPLAGDNFTRKGTLLMGHFNSDFMTVLMTEIVRLETVQLGNKEYL